MDSVKVITNVLVVRLCRCDGDTNLAVGEESSQVPDAVPVAAKGVQPCALVPVLFLFLSWLLCVLFVQEVWLHAPSLPWRQLLWLHCLFFCGYCLAVECLQFCY